MATLYISEFSGLGVQNASWGVQAANARPLASQTVSIGGASAQSSAFNNSTNLVRLHADAPCCFLFGSNPTATTSNGRMATNQTEYFEVLPGDKVACITVA